jgi:hypothetical protein
MRPQVNGRNDDWFTLAAISTLAYIVQDVAHEGVGHGVVARLSGAHRLTISTVALQSDIGTRWISAGGTLVNLLLAILFWFALQALPSARPAFRYFLVLNLAAALFTGTGYFFFSGVSDFGDWAAVITGMQPHWLWRCGLILLGAASYYASVLVVAREFQFFHRDLGGSRLRRLTWTPYCAEAVLAVLAGLLNPAGFFYVITAAVPSTMGANAGFVGLPFVMQGWSTGQPAPLPIIRRSVPWILAGASASALFIFVLGPGITWSR